MRMEDLPTPSQVTANLLATDYPRFSPSEMLRRRTAVEAAMQAAGVSILVLYGANRTGSAVQWLTGWPVTAEAAVLIEPGQRDLLLAHYYNHLPLAEKIAADADVRWAGPTTADTLTQAIADRLGERPGRIGIIGPMGYRLYQHLSDRFGSLVDLGKAYLDLRLIKSPEEIDWLRVAAYLSDRSVQALRLSVRPGPSEHELADIVERAYVPLGGTTHIHYLGVTSMAQPEVAVPRQFTSGRRVRDGDVIIAELSAAFWGYAGQVLRSFAVGAPPPPLYRDLMDVAEATFAAITAKIAPGVHVRELVEAAGLIREAGFTTIDDLVHGYGGGYLPPILSAPGRTDEPIPDITLREGMCVVVQPNVVTEDKTAGVQSGELVVVTSKGCESLHNMPRGFLEITGI